MALVRLTDRQILRAAHHETAHAVCARAFGIAAEPIVFAEHDDADPSPAAGQCVFHGWRLLTARERRVVALAGFVAELVYTGRQPPDLAFSPHDRRLAGPCTDLAAAAVEARDILQAQDRA